MTKKLLSAVDESVGVNLAPDSAILMSEQYPVSYLQSRASEALIKMIEGGPYVCFQAHVRYANRHNDKIVDTLGRLHDTLGLRALLLPIGRYVGLDDQMALRNIQEKMRTPSAIVSDEASIWEIMLVIARANLFLGTSLHGNVTSQSFAVPHLGLRSQQKNKLDHYLATWEFPEQSLCVGIDEVCQIAERAIAVPEATRQAKRAELVKLSHENFQKMANACALDWRAAA